MNKSSKKRFISHVIQLLLIPAFIGTMFLDNTYRYHSATYNYYYSYYYGYSKYKTGGGYSTYYNFFESVFDEVVPGIFGVLMFLALLLLLVLTIASICSKKASPISIVAFVIPFLITLNYGGYLISTSIVGRSLCEEAFIMFIPLALMNLASIIGFVLYAVDKRSNATVTVNDAPNVVPESTQFTSGVKYCTNCGNEVVSQAVVCPKCGCTF